MGVHSAGARLSSHCPGGCKSRYLHPPAPSIRVGDFQNTRAARGPNLSRAALTPIESHLTGYYKAPLFFVVDQ
jgi:hypothetical protein